MLASMMLIIHGIGTKRVVHSKKHVLYSDDPIVNASRKYNDGLADERCANGQRP